MRSIIALAAVALSTAASAAPIAGLANTGAGYPLGTNGIDNNWNIGVESAAYVSGTNGVFPVATNWLADNATSRWITPTSVAGADLDPVDDGIYTYNLNFDLKGFYKSSAGFTGRFSADNAVTAIRLNGNLLSSGDGGGFTSWTEFAASSGFRARGNTLSIDVSNFGQTTGNPSGLRVEFLSSNANAVPEPATWALLVAGFGLVGVSMRRRKAASVAA
ncbi:MAG: PEP-CTERM sorting domain-containing protein [Sandarakinorhabdus sp.]|nr:PEP-CTERM sorting domain-containing protein [Sandarakinorhabdus sp.]